MKTSQCNYCRKNFTQKNYEQLKYCNRNCWFNKRKVDNAENRKKLGNFICLNCGGSFPIKVKSSQNRKYCSPECHNTAQKITYSGKGNPNYGNHALKGLKRTPEIVEKIRAGALKTWETEERKTKQREYFSKCLKENGYLPWHSPEAIEKHHNNYIKALSDGSRNPKTFAYCGYYVSFKTSEKEYYHSSWELKRMEEFDKDENVIFWTKKHKICIHYANRKWYIPDFLVTYANGKKVLEEVKGYIRDKEEYLAKTKAAIVHCGNLGIEYFINFMLHLKNKKV